MHLRVGQRGKQMTGTGIKKKQKWFSSAIVLTLLLSICSYSAAPQSSRSVVENARLVEQESSRPNILLIVADDLGYTDLGAFGSEIDTPNVIELAIIPADTEPFPPLPAEKSWDQLTEQERKVSARSMEIYAAMIDDLDRYVGRVIDYLKDVGEYENTLIFFMSDNGAEGHRLDDGLIPLQEWSNQCCDNSYDNMGKAGVSI